MAFYTYLYNKIYKIKINKIQNKINKKLLSNDEKGKIQMFKLVKVEKSKFGKGEVWVFECSKCGHTERVSSSYGRTRVKCCVQCGEPVEKVGAMQSKTYEENDTRKLRYLLKRLIDKCTNPNNSSYQLYKNINVCKEWVEDTEVFIGWCMSNGYKSWYKLYRIDEHKDYCPENCYWASQKRKNYDLTNEEWNALNEKLVNIGLNIDTVAKNVKEYRLSKQELEYIVQLLSKNSSKDKLMNLIDVSIQQVIVQLKQIAIMQQAYNYTVDKQVLYNNDLDKVIGEISSIRSKL